MLKFIIGILIGIYIGAFIGLDRVNNATVYCTEKAKAGYIVLQQKVVE